MQTIMIVIPCGDRDVPARPLLPYYYCTSGSESRSDQMFQVVLLNFPDQAICPELRSGTVSWRRHPGLR